MLFARSRGAGQGRRKPDGLAPPEDMVAGPHLFKLTNALNIKDKL
jgi:hypothetical protein